VISIRALALASLVTPTVVREGGVDRYATAAAVSQSTFAAPVPVVFVARGDGFADALTAGPAAALDGGPVLLVSADGIPAATATELARLRPARVVVLGGSAAISDPVVEQLQAFTTGSVTRVAGADRYATAAAQSALTFAPGPALTMVAAGDGFPDALAGGAAAGAARVPLLLVAHDGIPPSTAGELRRLRPARLVILGGTASLSDAVAAALATFTTGTVTRWSGSDRYATAVSASQNSFPTGAATVFVASGLGFADALSGGVAAAVAPGPLLLAPGSCLPPAVTGEIGRLHPGLIVVLGGPAGLGPGVAALAPCNGSLVVLTEQTEQTELTVPLGWVVLVELTSAAVGPRGAPVPWSPASTDNEAVLSDGAAPGGELPPPCASATTTCREFQAVGVGTASLTAEGPSGILCDPTTGTCIAVTAAVRRFVVHVAG